MEKLTRTNLSKKLSHFLLYPFKVRRKSYKVMRKSYNDYEWNVIGDELRGLKRYKEARWAYECALSIDDKFPEAWNGKGYALLNLKCYSDALQAYKCALEIDPKFSVAWNGKGYALLNLNCYEDALQAYEQALVLDAMSASAWRGKGLALCHQYQLNAAIDCYDKANKINPEREDHWNNLGRIYLYKADYNQAITAYDKTLNINSTNLYALSSKALAYLMLNNIEKVNESIKKISELNKIFSITILAQSLLFYTVGNMKEASHRFNQLTEYFLHVDDASIINEKLEIYFHAITHFMHLKNYDLSKMCIDKALSLKADYLPILNLSLQLNNLLLTKANSLETTLKIKEENLVTMNDSLSASQIEKDKLVENHDNEIKAKTLLQQENEKKYQVVCSENTKLIQDKKQLSNKIEKLKIKLETTLKINEEDLTKIKNNFSTLQIEKNELVENYDKEIKAKTLLQQVIELLTDKINELQARLDEVKAEMNYDSYAMSQQSLEHYKSEYIKLQAAVNSIVEINEKQQLIIETLQANHNIKNNHIEQQTHELKRQALIIDNHQQENNRLNEQLRAERSKLSNNFFKSSTETKSVINSVDSDKNESTAKNSFNNGR